MSKLAIRGGKPVCKGLKAAWPVVDERDAKAVASAVRSGVWWRYGTEIVDKFESSWAEYCRAKHCLAIANGTVAIEAALKGVGMERGDEVIVPAVTFIATASAVVLAGGRVVFADVLPETCQLDPKSVEELITPRTSGIVTVHYAGYPSDLDALRKLAQKKGLFLIEDCAHAHGTEWRGRHVGSWGEAGTFSFQQSKSLASGEGGAVVTRSREVFEKAYAYHHIGRALGAKWKYEHTSVGPNYRITSLQAALLLSQMRKLKKQTSTRMRAADAVSKGLSGVPGICPLPRDKRITRRGYYFYVLRYVAEEWEGVPKSRFLEALRAEGIPAGEGYRLPVYKLPAFSGGGASHEVEAAQDYSSLALPGAERLSFEEHVTLASQCLLYPENARRVAKAIVKLRENVDEIPKRK